jgi:hypothetical protein
MRACALAAVYGALAAATLAWDASRRQPAAAEVQRSVLASAAAPSLALPPALAAPPPPAPVDATWAPAPVAPAPSALLPWRAAPDAASCSPFLQRELRAAEARHAGDVARAQQTTAAATLLGVALVAAAGVYARRKAAIRRATKTPTLRCNDSPATPSAEQLDALTEAEPSPEVTSAQRAQSSWQPFGGAGGPNAVTTAPAASPDSPFGTPRRAARAEEAAAAAAARAWKRNERGRLSHVAEAEDEEDEVCSPRL